MCLCTLWLLLFRPPASKHTVREGISCVETKTRVSKQVAVAWNQLCVVVVYAFKHFGDGSCPRVFPACLVFATFLSSCVFKNEVGFPLKSTTDK